jgi:hypothetical protein
MGGATWCERHDLLRGIFDFRSSPAGQLHSAHDAQALAEVYARFVGSLQVRRVSPTHLDCRMHVM